MNRKTFVAAAAAAAQQVGIHAIVVLGVDGRKMHCYIAMCISICPYPLEIFIYF